MYTWSVDFPSGAANIMWSCQFWLALNKLHPSCIFMALASEFPTTTPHPRVCARLRVRVCSGRPFNTTKAQKRSRSPRGRRPQYRMQMSSRNRMTISWFAYVRVFFNSVQTSLGRSHINNCMRRLSLGKWGGFFISGRSGFSSAGKQHQSSWNPTSTTTRIRVWAKQRLI